MGKAFQPATLCIVDLAPLSDPDTLEEASKDLFACFLFFFFFKKNALFRYGTQTQASQDFASQSQGDRAVFSGLSQDYSYQEFRSQGVSQSQQSQDY